MTTSPDIRPGIRTFKRGANVSHSMSLEEVRETLDPVIIQAETSDLGTTGRPQILVWARDPNRMQLVAADNTHHSFDTRHIKEKLSLSRLRELARGIDY